MDYNKKSKEALNDYYVFGILDGLSEMDSLIDDLRGACDEIAEKTESVETDFRQLSNRCDDVVQLFVEFMAKDSGRMSPALCEELWRLNQRYDG